VETDNLKNLTWHAVIKRSDLNMIDPCDEEQKPLDALCVINFNTDLPLTNERAIKMACSGISLEKQTFS
jgi:hypothetical protein